MDISSLRYLSGIQEETWRQNLSANRITGNDTAVTKDITGIQAGQSSFATAIGEEMNRLRETGQQGQETKTETLSEMLGSESGRQAVSAMAEASLNEIVLISSENRQQNTALETLLQNGNSATEELADMLEQVLNRLEEGNAVSK